jgi:hypothetical protein
MKKFLSVLFCLIIGVGLFVIMGTAGSADLNAIDCKAFIVQSLIGAAFMGGGVMGLKITDIIYFD